MPVPYTPSNTKLSDTPLVAPHITRVSDSRLTARGAKIKGRTPLAAVINARGYTGHQVTLATGIHPRILTFYTNGQRRPTVDHLIKLCRFLDVRPDDILPPKDYTDRYLPEYAPGGRYHEG